MVKQKYSFEKVLKDINVSIDIFQPNLTTKLSIEAAFEKLKDSNSVLDLGCGSGIIGIAIMKTFSDIEMFCSDVQLSAIENAKNNFIKNSLNADLRNGNLSEPWSKKKV